MDTKSAIMIGGLNNNQLVKYSLWLLVITTTLLQSCGKKNDRKESSEFNESDSSVLENTTLVIDETQNKFKLPIDSMDTHYQKLNDTIFGYRSGDTLTVESDMLFLYDKNKKRAVVGSTWKTWPINNDVIIIPYKINDQYPYPERIIKAFEMWQENVNVEFVPYVSQNDYIEFIPSNVTRSFVGRIKKRQTIELANWATPGNIAHELGHAMGLYHEQSRSDRDKFVTINCLKDINYRHAYKVDPYARNIGPYNFFSIMHYAPNDCLSIKAATLPPKIPGQRDSVSTGDYQGINVLYQLHPKLKNGIANLNR